MNPPGTILLVEDNDDDVFVFRRTLKKAKFGNPLQVVTDGQEAMDYLAGKRKYADREAFPMPFIVFLDLKLPYYNGFDVLTWVRQQPDLNALLIVVLTSSAEEKDHSRAYGLGARSYMVKPPRPEMLHELAKSLQSYWPTRGWSDPFVYGVAGSVPA